MPDTTPTAVAAPSPELGQYEHVFVDVARCCRCGWSAPSKLPAGTLYGRGKGAFAGEAKLLQAPLAYRGMAEVPGFVVERDVHPGWIDWSELSAPLCSKDLPGEADERRALARKQASP